MTPHFTAYHIHRVIRWFVHAAPQSLGASASSQRASFDQRSRRPKERALVLRSEALSWAGSNALWALSKSQEEMMP